MIARPTFAALALVASVPVCVHAQDFAPVPTVGEEATMHQLLERGLAPPRANLGLELSTAAWPGLPELSAHALALGGGWRSLRLVAGVSQSGDDEIGWQAAALAAGTAHDAGGIALRAVARRDRAASSAGVLGAGVGVEAGGGAWIEAGRGLRFWISSPQVWRRGEAPPLRRGLEVGGVVEGGGLTGWLARSAPAGLGAAARRAGLRVGGGPLAVWIEARDRPFRGAFGIAARAGPWSVAASIESHPVLGETVRSSVALGARAERP